jgi:cell division inhibitor SepF
MAVSDLWHRTLVYFGMADDVDDYDDEYDDDLDRRYDEDRDRDRDRDRERRSSAHEDLERSYRERPNVRRLGPRRRDPDFDDIFAEEPRPRGPAMRSVESRPQPAEVHLVVPKSFNDAQQIADKFKGTIPVILNLQSAETDLAKRLIDFSSGLTYALDGGMQRVADKVFMLTPRNVEVSAEERARLLEKGFFNQY